MHMVSVCTLYDRNRKSLCRVALVKESKNFYNLSRTNKFNWLMCNEKRTFVNSYPISYTNHSL